MAVLFRLSRNGEDKLILFVGLVRNPPCSKARQLFASALQIVWHEFCRRLLTEFSLSLPLYPYPILDAVTSALDYRVSIYSFLLDTIAPAFIDKSFTRSFFQDVVTVTLLWLYLLKKLKVSIPNDTIGNDRPRANVYTAAKPVLFYQHLFYSNWSNLPISSISTLSNIQIYDNVVSFTNRIDCLCQFVVSVR